MAGYIGTQAVSVNTTSATISDDLSVGDDITLRSDAAVLGFGVNNDVTLTHVHNTGLLLNSSRQLQFGDSATHIAQSADGVLTITSDNAIVLDAGGDASIDIDGADLNIKDGGVAYLQITHSSPDLHLKNPISDGDMLLIGNDGGAAVTALKLDMSLAGEAVFNAGVIVNESGIDSNFRVESNSNSAMLFVDAGNNRLQIGSAATDDDQMFQLILAGGSAGFGIHSNRAAAGGSSLIMSHNRNNAVGSFTVLNDGDTLGRITFQGCDGGDIKTEGAQISAEVNGTPGANDMPTKLVFSVTADGANTITEAMRISQNGNVSIGHNTSTNARLDVRTGNIPVTKIAYIDGSDVAATVYLHARATGSTTAKMIQFQAANGGEKGSITTTASATSYNTGSDYRLKENVSYTWDATTRIKQLKPARFSWIGDDTNTLVDGFLAHEAQAVVPQCATGSKDATRTATEVVVSSSNVVLAEFISQSEWTSGKLATTDADGNTVVAIYPSNSTWEAERVVPDMQSIDQAKIVPLLVKTILELEARITALEG